MKYLKQNNIGCSGTVKANMSQDCPLYPKSEFKRGLSRLSRAQWWRRNGNLE